LRDPPLRFRGKELVQKVSLVTENCCKVGDGTRPVRGKTKRVLHLKKTRKRMPSIHHERSKRHARTVQSGSHRQFFCGPPRCSKQGIAPVRSIAAARGSTYPARTCQQKELGFEAATDGEFRRRIYERFHGRGSKGSICRAASDGPGKRDKHRRHRQRRDGSLDPSCVRCGRSRATNCRF